MAYYNDQWLEGYYVGPKAVVFAKIDGRPRLVRLYQVWRYLNSGRYLTDPNKADNLDKEMVKKEMVKVMTKATTKLFYHAHPSLYAPWIETRVRFNESFERAFKVKYGITPEEFKRGG